VSTAANVGLPCSVTGHPTSAAASPDWMLVLSARLSYNRSVAVFVCGRGRFHDSHSVSLRIITGDLLTALLLTQAAASNFLPQISEGLVHWSQANSHAISARSDQAPSDGCRGRRAGPAVSCEHYYWENVMFGTGSEFVALWQVLKYRSATRKWRLVGQPAPILVRGDLSKADRHY